LDSTALNAKSFAFHLLRCKIPWILLATADLFMQDPSLDRRSLPSRLDWAATYRMTIECLGRT
jgi:hypothetical protein